MHASFSPPPGKGVLLQPRRVPSPSYRLSMSQLKTHWIPPRPPTLPTWMLPVSLLPIAELGIHPVVDPLDSKSRMLGLRTIRASRLKGYKQAGARNVTRLLLTYRRFFRIMKVFGSWQGNGFPPQSITTGSSLRVPVTTCTTPGACQHDFGELVVLAMQHYACDRERSADLLYVAEVLCTKPFQWDSRYHGCRTEGRARNICECTRGWLDPPHV